jgi:hypothetical protein
MFAFPWAENATARKVELCLVTCHFRKRILIGEGNRAKLLCYKRFHPEVPRRVNEFAK